MSAYIDVGFVYEDEKKMEHDLCVWARLVSDCCSKIYLKTKTDREESYQTTKDLAPQVQDILLNVRSGNYVKCLIKMNCNQGIFHILVAFEESEEGQPGIVFSISECELFDDENYSVSVRAATNSIAQRIITLCVDMNFKYAYCDCEAAIEYTIDRVIEIEKEGKSMYSITVLNDNHIGRVMNASWCVDGFTPRIE